MFSDASLSPFLLNNHHHKMGQFFHIYLKNCYLKHLIALTMHTKSLKWTKWCSIHARLEIGSVTFVLKYQTQRCWMNIRENYRDEWCSSKSIFVGSVVKFSSLSSVNWACGSANMFVVCWTEIVMFFVFLLVSWWVNRNSLNSTWICLMHSVTARCCCLKTTRYLF